SPHLRSNRSEDSGRSAGRIKLAVKTQIVALQHLGNVENLSVVHSEVFYDLKNSRQAGDFVTLNIEEREQISLREARKDFGRLLHGSSKLFQERRSGNGSPFFEFGGPIARVIRLVERRNQP